MTSWPDLFVSLTDLGIVAFAVGALWVRFTYKSVFSNGAIRHGSSLVVVGCGLLAAPFLVDLVHIDQRLLSGRMDLIAISRILPLLGAATLLGGVILSRRGLRAILENLGQAHWKLLESEQRWRLLANAPFEAIVVHDSGKIIDTNEAWRSMLGYEHEAMCGESILDVVTEKDRPLVQERIQGRREEAYEVEMVRYDDSVVPVRIRARNYPVNGRVLRVAAIRDLTEEKQQRENLNRTEHQLQQAQKMEAVGRLAAGVAHDFNNLLMVISGYTTILEEELPQESDSRDHVRAISVACDSAASLTRQLLAFSRKQVCRPKVLNLNDLTSGQTKMLSRLIGEDIDLHFVPGDGIGSVKADPHQLEQILMNLAVNARDAMPDGGRLTLTTRNARFDEQYVDEHAGSETGDYVMLAVSDTGAGIPVEQRSLVYEPFFTTKGEGKGTGLGLSTVYGIVKQSGGYIELYSETDQGTTFKIYLPRVKENVKPRSEHEQFHSAIFGTETILLVEDDPMLRGLVSELLQRLGYTVLEASGCEEARLLCERFSGQLHLVLTDVVMPNMNGRRLWEQIVALRPDAKVVFMSGYTDDAIVQHGVLEPDSAFIGKPFTSEALGRKIRAVLDA